MLFFVASFQRRARSQPSTKCIRTVPLGCRLYLSARGLFASILFYSNDFRTNAAWGLAGGALSPA